MLIIKWFQFQIQKNIEVFRGEWKSDWFGSRQKAAWLDFCCHKWRITLAEQTAKGSALMNFKTTERWRLCLAEILRHICFPPKNQNKNLKIWRKFSWNHGAQKSRPVLMSTVQWQRNSRWNGFTEESRHEDYISNNQIVTNFHFWNVQEVPWWKSTDTMLNWNVSTYLSLIYNKRLAGFPGKDQKVSEAIFSLPSIPGQFFSPKNKRKNKSRI